VVTALPKYLFIKKKLFTYVNNPIPGFRNQSGISEISDKINVLLKETTAVWQRAHLRRTPFDPRDEDVEMHPHAHAMAVDLASLGLLVRPPSPLHGGGLLRPVWRLAKYMCALG
jgi:hypothetical protein